MIKFANFAYKKLEKLSILRSAPSLNNKKQRNFWTFYNKKRFQLVHNNNLLSTVEIPIGLKASVCQVPWNDDDEEEEDQIPFLTALATMPVQTFQSLVFEIICVIFSTFIDASRLSIIKIILFSLSSLASCFLPGFSL